MRKALRSRGVLAFLCGLALLQAGCGTIRTADGIRPSCPGGSGSIDKGHPLICIDDSTLAANPDPATVWDREKQPDDLPSEAPVTIVWVTKSGRGKLGIDFKQMGCIRPGTLRCPAPGFCTAQTERVTTPQPCEYGVLLDGRKRDPVVIVQPCCT